MKKILFLLAIIFCQTAGVYASNYEDLATGFYAVVDEDYIPLTLTRSTNHFDPNGNQNEQPAKVKYKGDTSDTMSTGKFILVCDPAQEEARLNNNEYSCFARFVTPPWFSLVRLQRSRTGGRYYQVTKIWPVVVGAMLGAEGVEYTPKKSRPIPFAWKKVGRGVFAIDADLSEGEYAFVLTSTWQDSPDLENVFDFTVKENK